MPGGAFNLLGWSAGTMSTQTASQGVFLAMSIHGTFRIHFNRHGAAPLVWYDPGDEDRSER